MIPARLVSDWLRRPLRDLHKYKRWSRKRLLARLQTIKRLPPSFPTLPMTNQLVGMLIGAKYNGANFFYDMGTGKTKLMLDLIEWRRRLGDIEAALVLVPNLSNVSGWLDQVALHQGGLKAEGVTGSRGKREAVMTGNAAVVVLTYAGFLSLVCKRVAARKKNRMVPDAAAFRKFTSRFQFVVFDESTQLMGNGSLTARVCCKLGEMTKYHYGLTGTPFGRDPHALWSQFRAIDGGETLGSTLPMFRASFFLSKLNPFSGFPEYKFDKRKKKELSRVIRNRSVRYKESEVSELPPLVRISRPVDFPDETWVYYDKLVQGLIEGDENSFRAQDNVFLRMRQLTSGFLGVKGPESTKTEIVFKNNPKMDALIELLYEIPEDRKIVVFHDYRKSGEMVSARLTGEKIRHVRLYGGIKDHATPQRTFNKDPACRVFLASSAGAFGLNLQVANYVVFYESPVSPIIRQQMEKRCHRTGQTRRTFIYDLFVRKSVDEKILRYLREGRDLFRAILDKELTIDELIKR